MQGRNGKVSRDIPRRSTLTASKTYPTASAVYLHRSTPNTHGPDGHPGRYAETRPILVTGRSPFPTQGGAMRLLGAFRRNEARCDLVEFGLNPREGIELSRQHSSADGQVAVRFEGDRRDLSFAADESGFVLLDGEIYAIEGKEIDPASGEKAARAVLDLYRRNGLVALRMIECSAAITIWDESARKLIVARDRFGLAPCYWMESRGAFLWSSDLITLLRLDPRTELDLSAIDLFLTSGFITAPWTSLKHIRKIPAAHCLIVTDDGVRLQRYWRQTGQPKLKLAPAEIRDRIEDLLLKGYSRRLPGQRPSAVLLSGGIDSMLLAALLTHLGARPETFTFRYTQYEGRFNEGATAARAASQCGLSHREIPVRPEDVAGNFERILLQHQGPLSYGTHTAILGTVAATGAEIVYSGQGNAWLSPSRPERLGLALGRLGLPYQSLARVLERTGGFSTRTLPRIAAYTLRVAGSGLNWRFHEPLTGHELRRALYQSPGLANAGLSARQALFEAVLREYDEGDPVDRLCSALQRLYTADATLHWMISFSRAHGLLPRCPYFDTQLNEFMYRVHRGLGKCEIRDVASRFLPADLAYAPSVGQTIPLGVWFRGPLSGWLGERLDANLIEDAGLFRPNEVRALYERHVARVGDHGWTLWLLAVLTAWQSIVRREAGRALGVRTAAA
jgi:asparagine synthase (glutamine-hydrolysing)